MKKIISLVLVLGVFAICLCSCSDKGKNNSLISDVQSEINSEIALNRPPELTILYGKESIKALRGTTSWTYANDDGTSTSEESDSLHPLQAKDYMTPLSLLPSTLSSANPLEVNLRWDYVPDEVTVRCWSEECWGQTGDYNNTSEEIPVKILMIDSDGETEPIITTELKDGNYIYEVTAEWNSYDKFSGTAHYSFYTITPDEIPPSLKSE